MKKVKEFFSLIERAAKLKGAESFRGTRGVLNDGLKKVV